ncbi:TlyA family RNA methyltransferase [Desulforamulus hydrothermalis]|uniref:Putative rRNA methyltransferase YqxC n=1 Tax=Desulforamulus hydrothermalis Lam5 = DSM 18033 TaxID=1121428 RepID=K8EBB6_9FIRM|nr:TlyA family RNA methyltransferase [Desulforamulus hydrothermalis]CCO08928.1 putative rRNA methyltransferase YqxC [Desulforamulus hydrothermalis Lam5 = DSM 18033]SHG74988.1 23S rRNA (cytidine1920-2'-O)/16S rRNA (cytidine1409-2'-O)-methyltransferase [Desulforamulus hydrothermalis Lam5 = DSM 18033]
MAVTKERLDVYLVNNGYFSSREKARAAVMAGLVFVDGAKVDKPGHQVKETARVEVQGNPLPYVSRGGLKLAKAIRAFGIDLKDKVVIDIGASTGGFTDCALQQGARLVYAVDVGYGQLAWKLRSDPRVISLERTNIRYLEPRLLPEKPSFATIDVSFISLALVLPRVDLLTEAQAAGIALIKPQFEAGKEKVGKKGVVRDPAVHVEVIHKILGVVTDLGWQVGGLDFSPIRGPEGNIEYLLYFLKGYQTGAATPKVSEVVGQAHQTLG